ncbi:hypothetical protein JCM11251_002129 [Rhodosporidiobolus azoricus]
MSPFRTRHSPSASPGLAASAELPPHASSSAAPSRIPVSKSTSSLTLFRTRSRGNELDEVGGKDAKEKEGSASPEWTIRAVTSGRPGSKQDDAEDSPQRPDRYAVHASSTSTGQVQVVPAPATHLPPSQPKKLSKWLSRSTTSASAASNSTSSPPAPPAAELPSPTSPSPLKTRTTRSRSIGSLNLLSGGTSPRPSRSADPIDTQTSLSPSLPPPAPPSISISSSPSTQFSSSPRSSPALASSSSASSSPILHTSPPPDRPPAEPLRRGSVASTSTTKSGSSLRNLGVGGLKVRKRKSSKAKRDLQQGQSSSVGRKGKTRGGSTPTTPSFPPPSFAFGPTASGAPEPIDDWATADLSDGDEQGRIISEEMVRAVSRGSNSANSSLGRASGEGHLEKGERTGGGGGVLAKSLRRTKSGLRLFGGGGAGEAARSKEESNDSSMNGAYAKEAVSGSASAQHVYRGGGDALSTSTSVAPTPTSAIFPASTFPSEASASQQPQQQPQSAAGRFGGWFSSMLHGGASSPSTHLPLPSNEQDPRISTSSAPVSPEKSRRSPLFSSSSPESSVRLSSPQKKGSVASALSPSKDAGGGGRLGAFDRIFDRAAQYFFDSDSKADECTEEIWVLGVRHPGFAPQPVAGGTEGDEVEQDEEAKKRRSLPSLGRKSRLSPVKNRKNAPATAPPVPTLPSSVQGDPFLVSPSSSTASVPMPAYSPTPSSASLASSSHHSHSTTRSSHSRSTSPSPNLYPTHSIHGWPSSFYHDFYSRIALTYRTGFPLIPFDPSLPTPTPNTSGGAVGAVLSSLGASIGRGGSRGAAGADDGEEGSRGLRSDTGWGCMLRTGQSLLANALGFVHLGREWRRPLPSSALTAPGSSSATQPPLPSHSLSSFSQAQTYARLLSLFLDAPSPSLSPFSVHAFAQQGRLLGKAPGEWFGPSTAAGAIKALVNGYEPAGLRVVSCIDGAVYESEVKEASKGWKKPVLVLVNVRLGIDGVNPIYHEAIRGIFRLPQTVGIAGGRPSSSYYFVGAQANSLFYIDPHHPRPAVPVVSAPKEVEETAAKVPLSPPSASAQERNEMEHVRKRVDTQETAKGALGDSFVTIAPHSSTSASPSSTSPDHAAKNQDPLSSSRAALDSFLAAAYSDSADWSTYHAEKVRKCALSSLDPSMLLGFLVQDEEDWRGFRTGVEELFRASAPIFSIANSPPSWMRRTVSSSVPPPGAASSTAADDSFDDLAASPVSESGEAGRPDSSTGFSEPDDWELDSTDGLSSSPSPSPESEASASISGAERSGGKAIAAAAAEEGWEDGERSSPLSGRAEAAQASSVVGSPAVVVEMPSKTAGKELEAEGWEGV